MIAGCKKLRVNLMPGGDPRHARLKRKKGRGEEKIGSKTKRQSQGDFASVAGGSESRLRRKSMRISRTSEGQGPSRGRWLKKNRSPGNLIGKHVLAGKTFRETEKIKGVGLGRAPMVIDPKLA